MKRLGLASVVCVVAMGASGAEAAEPLWRAVSEAVVGRPAEVRVLPAGRYGVYALDRTALGAILDRAPLEFTDAAKSARTLLLLPLPDGRLSLFRIEATPLMSPELQARYPEIRTFRGQGITDRTATVRFDLTPRGFHALILSGEGTVLVDPWGPEDVDHYVSYYKRDLQRAEGSTFHSPKVTDPDTAITWTGGARQTVAWSVASTDLPPLSCVAVNLLLSTDGGNSFPTTLLAGTPNDGTETVTAPSVNTSIARVKVECATSPFSDVSSIDFTIVAGTFTLSVADAAPVTEGNAGNVNSVFVITLSPASGGTVTVQADTADGTATVADNDYLPITAQTVTFNPGETSKTLTVSVVGDLNVEADETFSVVLSNPTGGASIGDGTGVGTILNDDIGGVQSPGELNHDSRETVELRSQGGVPRPRFWGINQDSYRSYEVVLDAVTGDVAAAGLRLDRLASDGVTVIQSATPVSGGSSVALRFKNSAGAPNGSEFIRATTLSCATCDQNDTVRVRAYETTYRVSRFNNSATQVTLLVISNPTNGPSPVQGGPIAFQGTGAFFAADGTHLADVPFTLAPHGTFVLNTSTVPGLAGASGSLLISTDAPFGALTGKAVAVEPATGFTFDTAMVPRAASTKMVPRDN